MKPIVFFVLASSLAAACAPVAPGPAERAVAAATRRIHARDDGRDGLHAVIALDPRARAEARRIDGGAAEGGVLHGRPVLVKDSIAVLGMATTAGSLALKDNVAAADAPLAARLRAAGAVILGKTNLSEWSNFRASDSLSGWSAVGGMVRNPYALDRSACGSSAGSAAAVAAGYVELAVGAETNGSIVCPAAMTGVVGLKPTVGLVSRTGVVPISSTQDTAGPIAASVRDAALLLTALAGTDPADAATREADAHKTDYAAGLAPGALKGRRLGLLTYLTGYHPATNAAFARAVKTLKAQGAVIVPLPEFRPDPRLGEAETLVLQAEFRAGIEAYLAAAPAAVTTRSLEDLIAFNARTPAETPFFGQDTFEAAAKAPPLDDPAYLAARDLVVRLAGPEGLGRLLADNRLDALIAPSTAPAWRIDTVLGDQFLRSASGLPAMAGYPHLTVPMGEVQGLPVGLSLIGAPWSEATLLALAFAYEQARGPMPPPSFRPSVEDARPGMAPVR
jgi:amidase